MNDAEHDQAGRPGHQTNPVAGWPRDPAHRLVCGLLVAAGPVGRPHGEAPRRPPEPGRRIHTLLSLRHAQGPLAADRRRLRHGLHPYLCLARTHARLARRQTAGSRQRPGRRSRHRHAVLLLFGRPAVHRLPAGRGPARRDLLVPDLGTDGQRDRPGPAVRALRLADRPALSRPRARGRHRGRPRHRLPEDGTPSRGLGPRYPVGWGDRLRRWPRPRRGREGGERLATRPRDRRPGLALYRARRRSRGRHPWLRARGPHGLDHGP